MDSLAWTASPPISFRYGDQDSRKILPACEHGETSESAPGGTLTRRIDLETMSRSLPLWPSDFPDIGGLVHGRGKHVGDQCISAGLARWVVLLGGGVWNFTPYSMRGQTIGGWTFGMHIPEEDYPAEQGVPVTTPHDQLAKGKLIHWPGFPTRDAAAAAAEWKSLREYFLGDFYLLLPLTVAAHDWCAYQFHRDDLNSGVALFFRRHRSPFASMEIELRKIEADASYDVSLSATYQESPRRRMSGWELARLSVTITEIPGSLLLRYALAP